MTAFLLALLLALPHPISLHVKTPLGFAPLKIDYEVRIQRHPDNREACVTLVSGDEPVDHGCWDLAGAASSPVFSRTWKDLPGGTYYAQARVRRGTDTCIRTSSR